MAPIPGIVYLHYAFLFIYFYQDFLFGPEMVMVICALAVSQEFSNFCLLSY